MTADPNSLNKWVATQSHAPEGAHIVHTGEIDLIDDLKRGLAAIRTRKKHK